MLNDYHINNLSLRLSQTANQIMTAIESGRRDVTLYRYSMDEVKHVIEMILYDHPEYYDCFLQFTKYEYEPSKQEVTLQLRRLNCDRGAFDFEFNRVIKSLEKKINSSTTELEICKMAYDYLVKTVSFDYDRVQEFMAIDRDNQDELARFLSEKAKIYTAYGAIVDKNCVCMGLAFAYKMILNYFHIEATVTNGDFVSIDTSGNELRIPHMINVVEINNKLMYVDVSKGHISDDDMQMIRYDYFLVSNKIINKYFDGREMFDCVDDYNYLKNKGLYFKDLFELQKYLTGYWYDMSSGEIRAYYDSDKVDDDYLTKVYQQIINRRCASSHEYIGVIVEDGFLNGLIKKR